MLGIQSPLWNRLSLSKLLGFGFGLVCFLMLTFFTEMSLMFRIGLLFWYTTFGVFIGLAGTLKRHPIIPMNLPFWFRGIFFGAWLNFVLVLIAFPIFLNLYVSLAANTFLPVLSPFCFVLQGALIGLIIDYVGTKVYGEGESLVAKTEEKKKKKIFGLF